jgi:histidine triad (HIT) family protein
VLIRVICGKKMTIFSKIIAGEISCHKIAESDKFIAFLDIEPIVTGHVLVVPKLEINKIFEVPDDYLTQMLVFAKPIAKAIEKAFNCKRCGISVIGLEVPHAHMHLVPINTANDLNFTQPKKVASDAELLNVKQLILNHLNQS